MKKIFIAALAAAVALCSASCSGFLETNPTSSVSDNQVFNTIKGAEAALNGCYSLLHLSAGSRQDLNGYVSQIMTFDVDGEDVIVYGGWYGYDYNFWGHTRGDIFKSYGLWVYYYDLINNLNSIITYTPEIAGASEADINEVLGQAYALRGWAYFNLIQLYQHTYAIAHPKNMPGVPIYTEPSSDQTEGKGRGTIDETYNQILSDLTKAETMLEGFSRPIKSHVDQSVTRGFLAHVYLVMQDWANAEKYAALARANYSLTSNDEWNQGFNDINTGSWMWGLIVNKENHLTATGDYGPFAMWANWITRDGGDFWSFNCFFLNDKFAELFSEGDIRGKQIYWNENSGLHCSEKFYDNTSLTGSFPYMRSEDMLLVEAEAQARQGKTGEALALLNSLQAMRGAVLTNENDADALTEEILIERRKELYGEGYSWFDNIRNSKPLVREGNHANFGGSVQIPARSWRFVYQIPQTEIINNPNMSSANWPDGDQNPFDGVLE